MSFRVRGWEKMQYIRLDVFNNHNARAVFILNEEKFIPFKIFAKKILALTRDDGKIYDFIGTNRYGNSWAESMAQLAQRKKNGTINALPVLTQASYFTISRCRCKIY